MPKVLDSPPFYLTLEERDKVYYADLSNETPSTQVYRDIFMFHCLIGCRVGDLEKMTRANIVNGAVEYIAEKPKVDLLKIAVLKPKSNKSFGV